MILFLSIVLVYQLIILRSVFRIKNLSSPIYVAIYFYLSTGVIGYTVFSLFPDFASFGFTSYEILLNPKERLLTLQYFLSFINTMLLGSLVFLSIINISINKSKNENFLSSTFSAEKNLYLAFELQKNEPKERENSSKPFTVSLNPGILTFLCSIPTTLLIFGIGPQKILVKDYYLDISYQPLVTIASVLILPTLLVLGYNLANKTTLFNRFACLILILIDFIIFLSSASRAVTLLPFLVTFGYWFNSKRKKWFGIFLAALAGILFSPLTNLALFFRGQLQHGFLPYIQYALENPEVIFLSPLGIVSNLLFAFPLTGEIMEQRLLTDYPIHYLLLSLHPFPGHTIGWYLLPNILSFNPSTPFNTIGEMYLYGDVICFLLFFGLGVILTFITVVFQRNLEMGQTVYAVVLFVLILSFSFTSLQYNLRSSTRGLYLAFVLSCFFYKKQRVLQK